MNFCNWSILMIHCYHGYIYSVLCEHTILISGIVHPCHHDNKNNDNSRIVTPAKRSWWSSFDRSTLSNFLIAQNAIDDHLARVHDQLSTLDYWGRMQADRDNQGRLFLWLSESLPLVCRKGAVIGIGNRTRYFQPGIPRTRRKRLHGSSNYPSTTKMLKNAPLLQPRPRLLHLHPEWSPIVEVIRFQATS